MRSLFCLPLLLLFASPALALRVLVSAPNFMYSHLAFHGAIADLLADQGHQVTMLVVQSEPDSAFPPPHDPTWTRAQRVILHSANETEKEVLRWVWTQLPFRKNVWDEETEIFSEDTVLPFTTYMKVAMRMLLQSPQLDAMLAEHKFDVAIAEWFDMSSLALFRKMGISAYLTTTAVPLDNPGAKWLGIPVPSYVPEVNFAFPEGTSMGIWRRALSFWHRLRTERRMENMLRVCFDTAVYPMLGGDFPPPERLLREASFMLVNTNELLDFAKPTSAKVKQIGGFMMDPGYPHNYRTAQLEDSVANLFADPAAPVVFVSFGSVAKPRDMPPETLSNFLDAFSAFPQVTFVWRFPLSDWNQTMGGTMPANVHPFDWLDQKAILAHPNTRAFVSHCGLNSLNEAAAAGVPLLCVPLFGDQTYNSAVVGNRGNGLQLTKAELRHSSSGLKQALAALVATHNNGYASKAKTIAKKLARTPFPPRETIVKLVEFAAEFDGEFPELNLEAMSSWAQSGMDFIVPACLLALGAVAAALLLTVWLARRLESALWTVLRGAKGKTD